MPFSSESALKKWFKLSNIYKLKSTNSLSKTTTIIDGTFLYWVKLSGPSNASWGLKKKEYGTEDVSFYGWKLY